MRLPGGYTVAWADILGHFSDTYDSALRIYNRYKRFGLPYGGGWAEQPGYLITIIESVGAAVELYQDSKGKNNGGS